MPITVISANLGTTTTFRGFEPLTANYIYCPNQFFDVCLSHCSRGTVRLVGYMLRRTLGWLDENGDPIEQNVRVTYRELIAEARISRSAIRDAIDDAIEGQFIQCLQTARPKSHGKAAQTAMFTLGWDAGNEYVSNPKVFRGFYAGEGHRSPIPNAFFDCVVPKETLAVVKVVGTVLRHTVGYQNQFGGRRAQAPLSYSFIQKYTNIGHRKTIKDALRSAAKSGYICCTSPGCFDPFGGKDSRPTRYAVKWLNEAKKEMIGVKREPDNLKRCKKRTGIGAKTELGNRCKKGTDINTDDKDTPKQQQKGGGVMLAVDFSKPIQILRDEGFDEKAAKSLARVATLGEIQKQISWLDLRNPRENRLGMLRRSIEQKWSKPDAAIASETQQRLQEQWDEMSADRLAEQAANEQRRQRRLRRRTDLLRRWRNVPCEQRQRLLQQTLNETDGDFQHNLIRRNGCDEDVNFAVLQVFARTLVSTN